MRIFYCDCGQKMRVEENKLGRRGRCVKCGQVVAVTWENTIPEDHAAGHAAAPPPPPSPGAVRSVAGSDLSDAPPVEELLEPVEGPVASVPPPPPPPPPRQIAPSPERAVYAVQPQRETNSFDLLLRGINTALDWRKALTALAALIVMFLGALPLAVTAYVHPDLYGIVLLLWFGACAGLLTGLFARLINIELVEFRRPKLSEAFGFVGRHFMELVLVLVVSVIAALVIGFVVNGLAALVVKLPGVGTLLGALLVIPLFLFNFLLLFSIYNVYSVPCIMAVEDCTAVEAVNRLVRLVSRRLGHLLTLQMLTSAVVLPMFFILGLFVVVGLIVTLFVTIGAGIDMQALNRDPEYIGELLMGAAGAGVRLALFFAAVIAACFASLLPGMAVACLTVSYKSVAQYD